jgi:hypothetical protein
VNAAAGLRVEFRATSLIDFSAPAFDSGYVLPDDEDFSELLSGSQLNFDLAKFRAVFSVAPGQTQPPTIDTVIIPYEKVEVAP